MSSDECLLLFVAVPYLTAATSGSSDGVIRISSSMSAQQSGAGRYSSGMGLPGPGGMPGRPGGGYAGVGSMQPSRTGGPGQPYGAGAGVPPGVPLQRATSNPSGGAPPAVSAVLSRSATNPTGPGGGGGGGPGGGGGNAGQDLLSLLTKGGSGMMPPGLGGSAGSAPGGYAGAASGATAASAAAAAAAQAANRGPDLFADAVRLKLRPSGAARAGGAAEADGSAGNFADSRDHGGPGGSGSGSGSLSSSSSSASASAGVSGAATPGVAAASTAPATHGAAPTGGTGDAFGLFSLAMMLRAPDRDLHLLGVGADAGAGSASLAWSAPEPLLSTFSVPWAKDPSTTDATFAVPACYARVHMRTFHFAKFDSSTLLYVFYSQPRDVAQAHAAAELYSREWRYHKDLKLWFRPTSAEAAASTDAERRAALTVSPTGWIYFDVNSWEKRPFAGNAALLAAGFLPEAECTARPPLPTT